jgi:hypothetical protein
MSLSDAFSNPFFTAVNNFMLLGEYKSFISKTAQPVKFVGIYEEQDLISFKILYSQSGGGLMLCLISINRTNNIIKLSSFVQIQAANMVDYCELYDSYNKCVQCKGGFHL